MQLSLLVPHTWRRVRPNREGVTLMPMFEFLQLLIAVINLLTKLVELKRASVNRKIKKKR